MGKKDQELREHHQFTIRQSILEHCANLLDDDNIIYHQRNLGICDPINREESELHIRMADAAYREYEKTMYPGEVPDREDEMREMLEAYVQAIENETIIVKENEDNDGWENFGGRFYDKAKKLLNELKQTT